MEPVPCAGCSTFFIPRNKCQIFCSTLDCQQVRKILWHKQKLATDPEYKDRRGKKFYHFSTKQFSMIAKMDSGTWDKCQLKYQSEFHFFLLAELKINCFSFQECFFIGQQPGQYDHDDGNGSNTNIGPEEGSCCCLK